MYSVYFREHLQWHFCWLRVTCTFQSAFQELWYAIELHLHIMAWHGISTLSPIRLHNKFLHWTKRFSKLVSFSLYKTKRKLIQIGSEFCCAREFLQFFFLKLSKSNQKVFTSNGRRSVRLGKIIKSIAKMKVYIAGIQLAHDSQRWTSNGTNFASRDWMCALSVQCINEIICIRDIIFSNNIVTSIEKHFFSLSNTHAHYAHAHGVYMVIYHIGIVVLHK